MPNTIAHLLFADEVLNALGAERKHEISKHFDAYRLGALGFDVFYVFRQLGLKGGRLANRLHRERIAEVLRAFASADGAESGILRVYGAGLTSHYALDAHLHPAVCFLAERTLPKRFSSEYQNALHNLVETALDEWTLSHCGKDPRRYDASKDGRASSETKRAVSEFYANRIFPLFGETISAKKISLCFTSWNLLGKMWRDPNGRKKRFVEHLERHREKRQLTALLRPIKNPNGADLLNLEKQTFPFPRGGFECSNRSLPELYSDAIPFAVRFLEFGFAKPFDAEFWNSQTFTTDFEGILIP